MRATISGNPFIVESTSDRDILTCVLRYVQFYNNNCYGQQVIIHLDKDEIFEDVIDKPETLTEEETIVAMKNMANKINDIWMEQVKDYVPFDEVNKLPLFDPKDIKLEVVMAGHWNGSFVSDGPVFQVLTKPWFGAIPFSTGEGYYYSDIYIPA